MRLIDADALIKRFEGLRDEHETHSISYNALYEVLVQQPTAYDVEQVIHNLECEKTIWCGMKITTTDIMEIDDAIEIVKAGVGNE